jgi:hypothetical protein
MAYGGKNPKVIQVNIDTSSFATKTDLTAKANSSDITTVNQALTAKADQTSLDTVTTQLAEIPTQTYITEKAKTVDVNSALSLKANLSDMTNSLSGKRDKTVKIISDDLDISDNTKKIKLINLSDEVTQAITGNAPVNNVLADTEVHGLDN